MRTAVWGTIRAGEIAELLVILLCLAGAAWAVLIAIRMRRGALLPPLVVSQLEHLLSAGEVEKAKELCVERASLRNVLFAGISRIEAGPESAARAAQIAARKETTVLRQRAGWLLLVAILALLVGPLGTAIRLNMVPYYRRADVGTPALAGTAASAVFLCAWWLFRNRAEMLAHEIEMTADDLISRVGADVAGEEQAKT